MNNLGKLETKKSAYECSVFDGEIYFFAGEKCQSITFSYLAQS